jgi:aminoglycoside phosphotransferase (APT) family kinase protein
MTDELAALARRHNVSGAAWAASQGVANRVGFLGDKLVVRIARPEYVADLVKEAAIIPIARDCGVRTPALVDFDDSCTLFDTPYMVLERVSGTVPPVPERPVGDPAGRTYRELGEQLALWHGFGPSSLPGVPTNVFVDPSEIVSGLAGYVNADIADWLTRSFDRLRPYVGASAGCLVHGDASPTNMLAEDGRLTALLDWGDAAFADPATDFAKLPLRAVPYALDGYLGGRADSSSWAARILWHHLTWALARVRTAPQTAPHWSAQPMSRLLEITRFYLADPPPPWSDLV